jgi:hypothetical protein
MGSLKTLFYSVRSLFRGEDFSKTVIDFGALPDDVQLTVATEAALVACIDLVVLQKDVWNELVKELDERGIAVGVSPQAADRFEEVMTRLNAAMKVAGEIVGVDEETMKELFRD